jgi:hypothetical protein
LAMAVNSSGGGILPASDSLDAFTIMMNRIGGLLLSGWVIGLGVDE